MLKPLKWGADPGYEPNPAQKGTAPSLCFISGEPIQFFIENILSLQHVEAIASSKTLVITKLRPSHTPNGRLRPFSGVRSSPKGP